MLHNIWGRNNNECFLRRKITVDGEINTAYARVFADTGYELFINGRFVAEVDEWSNVRDYDVKLFLNKGENIIEPLENYNEIQGLSIEEIYNLTNGDIPYVEAKEQIETFINLDRARKDASKIISQMEREFGESEIFEEMKKIDMTPYVNEFTFLNCVIKGTKNEIKEKDVLFGMDDGIVLKYTKINLSK